MKKVNVQNTVISADLDLKLDLDMLANKLKGAEYEPEQFPGLVYRLTEPKVAMLIFSTGKVNCTGAKSVEDAKLAIQILIQDLQELGVRLSKEPVIKVQNLVSTANIGKKLDLNEIATGWPEETEYEPEQFPGLVYRMKDPKVVLLLFHSGNIVCTGAKATEDAERALDKITNELKRLE